MTEQRVRRVSGQRVATYAGPSVRAPRREKQPQNRTIFARPKTPWLGIPRDTFGIPAATLAGVACPPKSDAEQRALRDASVARDDGYVQGGCQGIREPGCPIHSSRGRLVLCGIRWRSWSALGARRNGGLAPGEVLVFLL